jgi:hypothetical protein
MFRRVSQSCRVVTTTKFIFEDYRKSGFIIDPYYREEPNHCASLKIFGCTTHTGLTVDDVVALRDYLNEVLELEEARDHFDESGNMVQ